VRELGKRLGFTGAELSHLVTATAEVAGNAWRHAGGGSLQMDRVEDAARVGITVTATDTGPGIRDIQAAMRDGWSTIGSMGFGLPGARRLMDEFHVAARPGGGTAVTMTRWRRKASADAGLPFVDWAVAPEVAPAGRRAVVCRFQGGVLIAVVASLGDDAEAQRAADTVAATLEQRASDSPIALVERCHLALTSSSGVRIGLASLSGLDAGITWLGIGEVEVALVRAARSARPATLAAPALPGAVGNWLPPLRAATVSVMAGDTILLAAQGSLPTEERNELAVAPPLDAAKRLLGNAGRKGMVLVARRR
jgi:anti-sigma regulatory factor (Ser/Thr protein kinase)